MMQRNVLKLGMFGLVSGIFSYLITIRIAIGMQWIAGAVFGLSIAAYFLWDKKLEHSVSELFPWIIISTGSYYAAFRTTVHLGGLDSPQPSAFILPYHIYSSFFLGGVVGSLLMLFAFQWFLHHLSPIQYTALVLLGGILGLSGSISMQMSSSFLGGTPSLSFLFFLYVVWQTGMALGLGYVVERARSQK